MGGRKSRGASLNCRGRVAAEKRRKVLIFSYFGTLGMTVCYRRLSELPCGLVSSDVEKEDSGGILARLSLAIRNVFLWSSHRATRRPVETGWYFQNVRELSSF